MGANSMKGHNPKVQSRRERALAQRTRELAAWQDPTSELNARFVDSFGADGAGREGAMKLLVQDKTARCKQDISNLESKGIT